MVLEAIGGMGAGRVGAKLGSENATASLRKENGRRVIDFGRELTIAPGLPLQVVLTG
jgi:nitrous oxide reductase accessory protein NosL